MDHTPSSVSSIPMRWLVKALARYTIRLPERNVPAVVMVFTRKCPGYSGTGKRDGYGRGEVV